MSTQESRSHFGDEFLKTVRRIAKGMVSGGNTVPTQPRNVSGSVRQFMPYGWKRRFSVYVCFV